MKTLLFMLALIAPATAMAAEDVSLSSEIFVEKTAKNARGEDQIVRAKPDIVTPGDRLVFLISYTNKGAAPAVGFKVTNPVPAEVSFTGAESGAQLSTDGGATWGELAALKAKAVDGTSRAAVPADVTHIRWTLNQPIAAGSGGQLIFRGVVK